MDRSLHRATVVRRLLIAVFVAALVPLVAPAAAAGPVSPELHPPAGQSAVKPDDRVRFAGSAPAGSTKTSASIEAVDGAGVVMKRVDITSRLSVASDGTISGDVPLGCTFIPGCADGDAERRARTAGFQLVVTVDDAGTSRSGTSAVVPFDETPPAIDRYELIAVDVIRVVFTEPVVDPEGDDPFEWEVDGLRIVSSVTGTGATRDLRLNDDQGRDATPEVDYRPRSSLIGQAPNQPYVDRAGNFLLAAGREQLARDRVGPVPPVIDQVNDTVIQRSEQEVVGPASPVTVHGSRVTSGHLVRLFTGSTEIGSATAGAQGVTITADRALAEGTHVLTLRSYDQAQCDPGTSDGTVCPNASDPSAPVHYVVDVTPPAALSAVGDGRFVTVRFSEPVTGADRAQDWRVGSGGPVESVSGSGDTRVIRTASTAGGDISWTPPASEPYTDGSGNRMGSFRLPILRPGDLGVSGTSAVEGASLDFTVTVARPEGDDTEYSVAYATEDGTAVAGRDYTSRSGRLTFSGSETSKTVSVPTSSDDVAEEPETVTLRLSNPGGGATLPSPATATATILEPGAVGGLSVFDTRAHEGSTARAVVQLASATADDVTVRWATRDGTATAPADYRASSGTVRIPAGSREATIVVPLTADEADESTETFSIELSEAANAAIQRATATVSILDGAGVAPGIGRISGPSRVETSAAISKAFYATADTVVVATANAYPDALAGAPLAEKHAAPILLTTPERLHPAIRDEVKRLGATTALVLGGPAALSGQVDRDLRAAGVTTVRRLSGQNRFDTARVIAAEVGGSAVYVVEGANADPKRGWPDAVAVSALAAAQQRPILLVERTRLPSETAAALNRLSPDRATIVGGPAAVNDDVRRAVDQRAGDVDRVAGRTRYETSRAVASRAVVAGFDPGNTFFATGDDWPDSLSASPAVARTGGILLLVDSDRLDDSPPAREWLVTHRDGLRSITLVGGPKAISSNVSKQIQSQSGLKPR
ncbi:MAG: cell wall-binding repeat-containing protein [Actinobacteria bacterium]|nr:cell wall-binding repeat-containing protein [Actinomycetota bacterium]